jgi:hypothetical protein
MVMKTVDLDEIEELGDELFASMAAALENMFVSIKKADENSDDEKHGEHINGSIWIKTAFAMYSLELLVPEKFLDGIAADIVVPGTDSEAVGSIVIDMLLELANTVSGSLMRNLETRVGEFTLEIPEFEIGKNINKNAFFTDKYITDCDYPITVAMTKI